MASERRQLRYTPAAIRAQSRPASAAGRPVFWTGTPRCNLTGAEPFGLFAKQSVAAMHILPSVPRRLVLAALLGGWVAALLGVRLWATGSPFGLFLAWNLVLAAVPLVASTALVAMDRRRTSWMSRLAVGAVWLAFLPNAPYILTDLVHLESRPGVPFWYDLALLLSAAGVGLLSGYVALADVQGIVARRWGPGAGWASAVGALFLSAFGVYLGRVLRWNSWDVVTAPGRVVRGLAAHLTHPLADPTTAVMTLVFGGMLTLGYVTLHALAAPSQPAPRAR